MQRVGEAETLVQGEFYLVPCVQVNQNVVGFKSGSYVPIVGLPHSDPEIGFALEHWHYDFRFIKAGRVYSEGLVLTPNLFDHILPEWKKRKCLYPNYQLSFEMKDRITRRLEPSYREYRLGSDRICPHRGASLKGCPVHADGSITCPVHGLSWDAITGKLVSAVSEVPQ